MIVKGRLNDLPSRGFEPYREQKARASNMTPPFPSPKPLLVDTNNSITLPSTPVPPSSSLPPPPTSPNLTRRASEWSRRLPLHRRRTPFEPLPSTQTDYPPTCHRQRASAPQKSNGPKPSHETPYASSSVLSNSRPRVPGNGAAVSHGPREPRFRNQWKILRL